MRGLLYIANPVINRGPAPAVQRRLINNWKISGYLV